jgi:hypothetical protein
MLISEIPTSIFTASSDGEKILDKLQNPKETRGVF